MTGARTGPAVPVFETTGAGLRFGATRALAGVDLTVHAGERVAVIGPSGAGKTSLIGLLNGATVATEGRVRVFGRDLDTATTGELRAVQRRIGTVHQRFDLVEQLRVVHNVNAGRLGDWPLWKAFVSLLSPRGVGAVRDALAQVGIEDKLNHRTAVLSGGEQQRVAIARVLVGAPEALLADEPIASLDRARGSETLELLHELSATTGMTLLASLHDVDAALAHFDRVIGLRAGHIVFDRPPGGLAGGEVAALYGLEPT